MATRSIHNEDAVKGLLYQLRDAIRDKKMEEMSQIAVQLKLDSTPDATMQLVAASLFVAEAGGGAKLSQHDSLSMIMFLASRDEKTYLKAASRAVKDAAQALASAPTHEPMVVSDELLSVLVAQLSGQDVEVASNASIVVIICCRRLGEQFTQKAMVAIAEAWKKSLELISTERQSATTICIRCAAALVDIMCIQEAYMDFAVSIEATKMLVTMMTDDSDPLLQMSVLDVVETMATTEPVQSSRARWLYSADVLHPLLQMSGGQAGEYPDPILGGPALRLLSKLCHLSRTDSSLFSSGGSELLEGFHRALLNFDGRGELDRLALIDAISSFAAASPESLELVLNDEAIRDSWMSLSVAQPKLKAAILHSVSMVMQPRNHVHNAPSNANRMRLFSCLGQTNNKDTSELLLSMARSPIVEARLGAYDLMAAFARNGTGAQVLLSHGGFYEFLTSREGEDTKDGKEAKYGIVQAVVESPARQLLADNIVASLEKYLRQGPYFVQTQRWDVMTE